MVWLQRLSHLVPGDPRTTRYMYLQLLLVILRIVWTFLTRINGYLGNYLAMVRQDINGYLGNYLAMVRQDMQNMLHRCQFCVEIKCRYVEIWEHKRNQDRKQSYQSLTKLHILMTFKDHPNFKMQFQCVM